MLYIQHKLKSAWERHQHHPEERETISVGWAVLLSVTVIIAVVSLVLVTLLAVPEEGTPGNSTSDKRSGETAAVTHA